MECGNLSFVTKMTNLLALICLLISTSSFEVDAQSFNVEEIKSINVESLSDDQVLKFWQEVEKRGISDDQLDLLAQANGISSSKIQQLRQRLNSIDTDVASSQQESSFDRIRSRNLQNELGNNDLIFEELFEIDEETDEELVFGMEFFSNPNLSFEPNLNIATPKNYLLGPGDQVIVDIWGNNEKNFQFTVSPEGSIFIPNIGPLFLSGKNIESAEKLIRGTLKRIYSDLGTSTFIQVSLGQIRSIQVNVVGEVEKPGTYQLSAFASSLNALYYAGGPSPNGSLRVIELYRDGKNIETFDLYRFMHMGSQELGRLQDQDLIIVRPYSGRVLFQGEVKRPGLYEIKSDEVLSDLIEIAGGFSDQAYKGLITVRRNSNLRKTIITIDQAQFDEFELEGGDEILISQILDQYENRVQIGGAINKPGEYELTGGLTLINLIERAEGLRPDAFPRRGVLIRENSDNSLSSISFDLQKIMNGEEVIELKNGDIVDIKSKFDLQEDYLISIDGEVQSPGKYPYIEGLTVEDLIYLANGFKESAARSFIEVARRIGGDSVELNSNSSKIYSFKISDDLSLSSQSSQFLLKPFDLVIVRKSPNFESQKIIEIEGEVSFPGKYALQKKDERVSDLLDRAGGLTEFGFVKGATLIRRTEYYVDPNEDVLAAKQRRENLRKLSERDSTLSGGNFELRQQESIGINLAEIIKNPGSKYDLILKEGDVLSIPRLLQTVRLRGELLYPSTVRYDKGLSFKSYISSAGGFTDGAKRGKSYVINANGSAQRTKNFLWFNFYPKVEPGAEIIVPRKAERRKLSPAEIVSITSGVATLSLVIIRIFDTL